MLMENAENFTEDKESKLNEIIQEAIETMYEAQANVNKNLKRYNIHFGNEDNPGIQFNNKINELAHEFRRAGLDFHHNSSLRDIISLRFQYYLRESQGKLKACNDSLVAEKKNSANAFLKRLQYKSNLTMAEKYAEEYRGYGNGIYSFTIEKDIIGTIVTILGTLKNQKSINALVTGCERELQSLGYGHLVSKLEQELVQNGYKSATSEGVAQRDVKEDAEYDDR